MYPKVAIVYLSYHSDEYLSDMVAALEKTSYPKDKLALVVVDNPHAQFGLSKSAFESKVLPRANKELPAVVYLPQEKNTGFSGGNNVGINWALEHGYDYVYLHNQDGYMAPDCIAKLVDAMEADKTIGCAQSLILLHPETNKINSAGNSFSFLGFGYIDHFGKPISELNVAPIQSIGYASGAGLMLRADLVKKFGALDEELFAYHEDVEYSLRLKLAGYRAALVRDSIFYHKYVFNRSSSKFYLMERNRYAVLLMYYRWATLILLLPIAVVMEAGLMFFFIINGWWKEKKAIYSYWLTGANWKLWLQKRKKIQALRTITDRTLICESSAAVSFGDKKGMNNPLLTYIANPLMWLYKVVIQSIIFW